METRVRVVIQARMGSRRLPGKVLLPLAGEELLRHVVRRMQAVGEHLSCPLEVLVATTRRREDREIFQRCLRWDVPCLRGPAQDVLGRYALASRGLWPWETIVRATADNPLYCPRRAARLIQLHLAHGAQYTCVENLSYVVPEAIRCSVLRRLDEEQWDPYTREHVTPHLRRYPWRYRVQQLSPRWEGLRPEFRLTVDTPREYELMAQVFDALGKDDPLFPLEAVYEFLDRQSLKAEEPGPGRAFVAKTASPGTAIPGR